MEEMCGYSKELLAKAEENFPKDFPRSNWRIVTVDEYMKYLVSNPLVDCLAINNQCYRTRYSKKSGQFFFALVFDISWTIDYIPGDPNYVRYIPDDSNKTFLPNKIIVNSH